MKRPAKPSKPWALTRCLEMYFAIQRDWNLSRVRPVKMTVEGALSGLRRVTLHALRHRDGGVPTLAASKLLRRVDRLTAEIVSTQPLDAETEAGAVLLPS